MSTYESNLYGEPLGYQPVEFLDIPPICSLVEAPVLDEQRLRPRADDCRRPGRARGIRVRSRE